MRKIKILKVNPTTTTPGSIELAGNLVSMFQGKFFRNEAGQTQPGYTASPTAGYVPIIATTFDIVENAKYAGRYTVYTPTSAGDGTSSSFASGKTTARVNEIIGPLVGADPANYATDGYVTNISTYVVNTGTADIVIPPGVTLTQYPIELIGRNVSGWGEGYMQNHVNLTRNFAGPTPPANPFTGLTHYDTDDKQLRVYDGTSWDLVNKASFGVTFRHTQSAAATTWTVNHGLGLAAPFIAFIQCFIDTVNGPKLIMPLDVQFVSLNQLTVTFSNAEVGYVLVRP